MKIFYREPINQTEIVNAFTGWLKNEHSKRLMKNHGKIAEFSCNEDEAFLEFGDTQLMLPLFINPVTFDDYDNWYKMGVSYKEAISECLKIAENICSEMGTLIDIQPTDGLAMKYIVYKL